MVAITRILNGQLSYSRLPCVCMHVTLCRARVRIMFKKETTKPFSSHFDWRRETFFVTPCIYIKIFIYIFLYITLMLVPYCEHWLTLVISSKGEFCAEESDTPGSCSLNVATSPLCGASSVEWFKIQGGQGSRTVFSTLGVGRGRWCFI